MAGKTILGLPFLVYGLSSNCRKKDRHCGVPNPLRTGLGLQAVNTFIRIVVSVSLQWKWQPAARVYRNTAGH